MGMVNFKCTDTGQLFPTGRSKRLADFKTVAELKLAQLAAAMSLETLRLAHFFGGDAQSWLNLQNQYDQRVALLAKAATIAREIEPLAA